MTGKRLARYAIAAIAAIASLGAAGHSIARQGYKTAFLERMASAQQAPIPDGVLGPGARVSRAAEKPFDASDRKALASALWWDPLDPKVFNFYYVDSLRRNEPIARVRHTARLLSALGWRYTPAQHNLLMRAAFDERFSEVVDRADGLLRRQKMVGTSFAVLEAMEAIPSVHSHLMGKLRGNPRWRRDYLSVINPGSKPDLLRARISTLDRLLRSPGGVSREEIAPSLNALIGARQNGAAQALWQRFAKLPASANLVYDAQFQSATKLAGQPDLAIPFEWSFGQALGYSAEPSEEGAIISWDRRGVPVFLRQFVPVRGGHRYLLTLHGRSDAGQFAPLFAPSLVCGSTEAPLVREKSSDTIARYLSDSLPAGCDGGFLSINGAIDSGIGNVVADVSRVTLTDQ
jgi:hypothetical protein